jgi:Raf kinase inhibitor-like YbhB/YbcL family protein
MPDPSSHRYDIRRTRLRDEYDDRGVPDQHADQAANEQMQREHPPRPVGDRNRAAGPMGSRDTGNRSQPPATGLTLRSAAFNDHTLIPDRYSYAGGNHSPPLEWTAVPDGTAQLALLCEDQDAPGGTFTHWIVTRIPPTASGMAEGELPPGAVAGPNSFGEDGWGGPQPPVGDEPHRYQFRLYALSRPLAPTDGAGADDVRAAIADRVLDQTTLVGLFGR